MDKKRLLITASTFPRWNGDTEPRFILDYAKAMTKYYEVTVLVPSAPGAKDEEEIEGVRVARYHYFPIHKWETLCYPGAIVPRIKEKKIRICLVPCLFFSLIKQLHIWGKKTDIVHVHWLIPQGIMQTFIKDTPYLVTGHGGDVTSMNIPIIKGMKKKCLSGAFATIGVSTYIANKMSEICPNIKPEVISMGCDLSKFSPLKRVEGIFTNDKKNILFVGRLAEKKGLTYLIDAMRWIDARLYIVGKGPLEKQLKEQASVLGEKIVFLGAKTHDELPAILATADLFVAPSIVAKDGDQEGLPVSIMEAMASGLPVVAGISGGTKDIVKNGYNGYVLDATNIENLAEKINEIIRNDQLRNVMKENALITAEEFSYEKIAYKHYELIQKSLKTGEEKWQYQK